MSRVAIFIDGGYLAKLLEGFSAGGKPAKIDFNKLAKEIAKVIGDVEILRTYYYNCLPHQSAQPSDDEKKTSFCNTKFFLTT